MSILSRFREIRKYSLTLMEPLSVEDHLAQPIPEVSPPKWHLGHTTWFFEKFVLAEYLKDYKTFDPNFNYLFNSYYEAVGDRLLRDHRGNMTRPPLEKVLEYRGYVDHFIAELLNTGIEAEVKELIELGLNHEQQHQELFLADFKFILGCQPFHPVYKSGFNEGNNDHIQEWIEVPAGLYEIGYDGSGFSYDNEHQRHKVYLRNFTIAKSPVTNAEWLEFIDAGGYKNPLYWLSDGWNWVKENKINAPLYWEKKDGQWMRFTLSGLEEIRSSQAVTHISYYEAAAFADWKKMRLPTEAEWEVSAMDLRWGERWEWTNSAYLPYPGFRKSAGAVGEYNGKFMVNQMVLKGASVATSPGHSRKSYRNFFQPELRWQFTGLRLIK